MRLTFRLFPVAVILVIAACATGTKDRCDPIPAAIVQAAAQPVFTRCEVDSRTRPRRQLAVNYQPSQRCGNAVVHYVVDTTGAVIPATATVRRATEEELGKAVLDAVVRSRFYPARRNGIAVAQLDTTVWQFRRAATSGASLQRGAPPMTAGC